MPIERISLMTTSRNWLQFVKFEVNKLGNVGQQGPYSWTANCANVKNFANECFEQLAFIGEIRG